MTAAPNTPDTKWKIAAAKVKRERRRQRTLQLERHREIREAGRKFARSATVLMHALGEPPP